MTTLTAHAYAKINLTLDVGVRRTDGYHEVRSVMQTIGLHDTLSVTRTPDILGVTLEVAGAEAAGVPTDESNIVHKAAVRLQKIAAARNVFPAGQSGLHIHLHKRIPSQAGLGGGSSDAAAALLLVDRLFGLNLSEARLCEIGAALGADVPFFLVGGTALAEGLGERITPLPPLAPSWPLIVVKPAAGVSTPVAYAALDAWTDRPHRQATRQWLAGTQTLHNDFEAVALGAYPEIAAAHTLLSKTAADAESFKPLLCGSGAALFVRASSLAAAEQIRVAVRTAGIGMVWVTETVEAKRSE